MGVNQENKIIFHRQEEQLEEEITEDNNAELDTINTSSLGGINLVLILTYLSSSAQELEEINERGSGNLNLKQKQGASRSDLRTRRREVNEFRAAERQSSKVHTKIRDRRHCRRL